MSQDQYSRQAQGSIVTIDSSDRSVLKCLLNYSTTAIQKWVSSFDLLKELNF